MQFSDLNLNTPLLNALADLGLSEVTPIQQKVFSPIMAGNDVLGIAQTGTGKTFAYLLPLLRNWKFPKTKRVPEILIIVPTRELVAQVVDETQKLSKYTSFKVCGAHGGANIKSQAQEIHDGVDMVVATPGRLLDLVLNGSIKAKNIRKLVIDEVDEMLNLGFRAQLTTLIDLLPERRQNLMFSATLTNEIEEWIRLHFPPMQYIEAAAVGKPVESISQIGYHVPNYNTKINLLQYLLTHEKQMTRVLVFCKTKKMVDDLFLKLEPEFGEDIAVIHSNKSQNKRFNTVEQFESGQCRILLASDIMARGIDLTDVSHVINMNVPEPAENYMHRIGRTGRASRSGVAITFISDFEKDLKEKVESLMGYKIPMKDLPSDVTISDILIAEEIPQVKMKNIDLKHSDAAKEGKSFHDKKEKNKKVPVKITRADRKKAKYGKNYDPRHGK